MVCVGGWLGPGAARVVERSVWVARGWVVCQVGCSVCGACVSGPLLFCLVPVPSCVLFCPFFFPFSWMSPVRWVLLVIASLPFALAGRGRPFLARIALCFPVGEHGGLCLPHPMTPLCRPGHEPRGASEMRAVAAN